MRSKLIFACMAVSPLLVGASAPARLQPTSQWVVDYADDSCRLIRMFGDGNDETKLVLESIAPGQLTMVASGKPLQAPSDAINIATEFLPVQQKPFFGTPARLANQIPAVLWNNVQLTANFEFDGHETPSSLLMVTSSAKPKADQKPAETISKEQRKVERDAFLSKTMELEIKAPQEPAIELETGSLLEPMKALDQCDRDLLQHLGLDLTVQDKIARPVWSTTWWIDPSSYPTTRIMMGEEASVTVRALVDAAGKITACSAHSQYDAPDFNKAVCASLVKNAVLQPAQLADGTKVPSYFTQHVIFRIAE